MPMVGLSGTLTDHGLRVMPEKYKQRIFLVPSGGHIVPGGHVLDGDRVEATLNRTTGVFNVQVWSEPGRKNFYYTLASDWLTDPDNPDPSALFQRGWFEWNCRIYPGTGGDIGDLTDAPLSELVYIGTDVNLSMWPIPRAQLLFNPVTDDLYRRVD